MSFNRNPGAPGCAAGGLVETVEFPQLAQPAGIAVKQLAQPAGLAVKQLAQPVGLAVKQPFEKWGAAHLERVSHS